MKRRVMWQTEMPTAHGIGERIFSCSMPMNPEVDGFGLWVLFAVVGENDDMPPVPYGFSKPHLCPFAPKYSYIEHIIREVGPWPQVTW